MPTDTEIRFRSDITVKLVRSWGDDAEIAQDAQALDPDEPGTPEREAHILRSMLLDRGAMRKVIHTSPFEHSGMKVWVDAPAVVWWEWTRHRFMPQSRADHSFNLESGRYKVLRPHFYLPPDERPIREPEGFKPMRPNHAPDTMLAEEAREEHRQVLTLAWESYQRQIGRGVAREVARNVLGPAIYYAGRVSGGVLTWLHFFALRTRDDVSKPSSYPMYEIEAAARQCEAHFASLFPLTYAAFNEFGRVAP